MRSREDIEGYLERSGHHFREVNEGTWLVTDPSDDRDNTIVQLAEGLVIFRLKVLTMDRIIGSKREAFLERLLQFNAEDMVHGAYGVSQGDVVMTATLRLENLDFSEFSGTLDDFSVALTNHFPKLREFVADAV